MASRLTKGQKLLHTSSIKDNIKYKQDNTLTSPSPSSLVIRTSLHLLGLIFILLSFISSFLIVFFLLSFLSIILIHVFLNFRILHVPLIGFLSFILFFNFLATFFLIVILIFTCTFKLL